MKLIGKTVSVMMVLLLFPCSCIEEETSLEDVVTRGMKLPDFTVVMNDSTTVTGATLRNTVSVVMFFHTGCPDCQEALPRIQRLYDEYVGQGVAFALISREEEAASVAAYWAGQGFTMPYSAQPDRKVYELFAYERVPRIYISECGGTVRYIFTDDPVPDDEALSEAMKQVLLSPKG